MTLATLTQHGRRLKSSGYIPANMPEIFCVRCSAPADNVPPSYRFVADDYDGNGVVALKAEDFRTLIAGDRP